MDRATRHRSLYLVTLAAVIALVAAASAWAAGSGSGDPAPGPAQYQPAQDDGSARPDGDRRDGHDCPDGDRGGGGGGESNAPSTTPDASTAPEI